MQSSHKKYEKSVFCVCAYGINLHHHSCCFQLFYPLIFRTFFADSLLTSLLLLLPKGTSQTILTLSVIMMSTEGHANAAQDAPGAAENQQNACGEGTWAARQEWQIGTVGW